MKRYRTPVDKFQARIPDLIPYGDCLLWPGNINSTGYGLIRERQPDGRYRRIGAHRIAWEIVNGEIPEGLEIDHQCHNEAAHRGECNAGGPCPHRACVNVSHLRAVTHWRNAVSSPIATQKNKDRWK